MDSKQSGRRRFLRNGAALAGMALAPAGGVAGGEAFANANDVNVSDQNAIENVLYGRRSRFVTTTRVIEGTASTNLYGTRRFRVTTSDNGELGPDTFQLELDTGYVTHGTLWSGTVELLLGNARSTPPAGTTCAAP